MKKLRQYILMLCVSVFMYGCGSYTPKENNLSIVLLKTKEVITNLGEKVRIAEDDSLIKAYDKLEKKYSELLPALEKCNEKYRLTTSYITTLEEAQNALQRLHKTFNKTSNKTFILNAIYMDYDAKLTSINSSAPSDANTKIRVIVDSSEDEGFFVFGKLSYEQGLDIKRFRFTRPTHNASQDFVPGYYLFWLEKEDRIGEPELHLIMSNGIVEEKKLVLKTPK